MGQGERKHSDHVAVEAMRKAMDTLPMRGTVVIGEGERDEAPMLYIGEKVGRGRRDDLEVDIAVDPLEGTNLCATGAPSAIAVLAASNQGGLLHAPDCYMEKIIVGPAAQERDRHRRAGRGQPEGDRALARTARRRTWSSSCSTGRGTRS